jgi:hypothetical protein
VSVPVGGLFETHLTVSDLSRSVGVSLHVAFSTSLDDVLGPCDRLRSAGVTQLSFGIETTEPSVIGWMPAAAVYFRDPRRPSSRVSGNARPAGGPRGTDHPLVAVGRVNQTSGWPGTLLNDCGDGH